jgi:hypothetical protein
MIGIAGRAGIMVTVVIPNGSSQHRLRAIETDRKAAGFRRLFSLCSFSQ